MPTKPKQQAAEQYEGLTLQIKNDYNDWLESEGHQPSLAAIEAFVTAMDGEYGVPNVVVIEALGGRPR